MHVAPRVFDIETTVRKLSSRFQRAPQVARPQWPVISASRPLFYLIRLFGVAPFDISEDRFIPGRYGVAYSLFCTLLYTYCIYTVLRKFSTISRDSIVLDYTETAKVACNSCVALANVLEAVWSRRTFIEVLNIVRQFDLRVRDLGHPRKERAAKVWVWSSGVCIAFLWTTVSRAGMTAFGESWIDNMTYLLNYIATSMSIVKFSGVVLLLGQRFKHLNGIAQSSKDSITIKRNHRVIDLRVILQLHNSLMNAAEGLSSQQSWVLFLWLINLCGHGVSNLYFLIYWLMITPEGFATSGVINCLVWWFITFVAQILLLHIACHITSVEANSMGSIVINWTSSSVGRHYRVEPLLHLMNRTLNFSAAGCFHVNLPLLRSMTALLTTYLVLLLQFQVGN